MHLIADNAAGHLMRTGQVDAVLVGADRVAANGDVANKIGTYKLAVVARENGIPVYAVVPTSTIDLEPGRWRPDSHRGARRRRGDAYRRRGRSRRQGVPVYNPAFDVTPHRYLTGIVTEEGVCYPPFDKSLREAKAAANARRGSHRLTEGNGTRMTRIVADEHGCILDP